MGRLLGVALAALILPAGAFAHSTHFWSDARTPRKHYRSPAARVAREAMPSVVSITTVEPPEPDAQDQGPQQGVGAGFIISRDGYIVTSAHVIDSASAVKVTVVSSKGHAEDFPARIVGVDEDTDFALLKINAHRALPHLELGSSKDVDVADWLVVIGSPFGLARSVSVGVVSFKGRDEVTPNGREGYFDYLQTDAAINPGNSGGPILDLHGHVVAIANAVNVAGQGIGFAVPVDIAKQVLPDLRSHGHVLRGWMGISVEDLSPERARSLAVHGGVVVSAISPGSPAERAGLKVGDVITRLDHRPIDRAKALRFHVGRGRVGREVELTVTRAGVPFSVGLTLADPPAIDGNRLAQATRPAPAKPASH
jgi:serine protease Do